MIFYMILLFNLYKDSNKTLGMKSMIC